MTKRHRFRVFWGLPIGSKGLLIEAWGMLVFGWILVRLLPFRWYGRVLAVWKSRDGGPESGICEKVSWAIATAAPYFPGEASCLVRAIAARWMLSRRGFQSTLFLGTRKIPAGDLAFHAWLTSGEKVICGHHERDQYTVVHSFS